MSENYELTGGDPKKPMPIMDNFVRDDWGGLQENRPNPEEANIDNFNLTGGTPSKPYPTNRNFKMGTGNDGAIDREAQPVYPSETDPDIRLGQKKYAKRAGAVSVYKDATRNTADDNEASMKTQRQPSPSSTEWNGGEEGEESQYGSI